jgi:tellurite resistance protein TerC
MTLWIWIAFVAFVLVMLALDLGVFNRKDHVIRAREALAWTSFWIVLALLFNVLVYYMYRDHWLGIGQDVGHPLGGKHAAIQFLTGYIIEKSLSLDNIFVIALIFSYFKVPAQYQHRVLFWGILGALLMRGAMIGAGAALISRFSWAIYIFGGFLVFTALRMLVGGDEAPDLEHNRLVRWTRRIYPVSEQLHGHDFFARLPDGRRAITPLFLVLLLVESSDVIFAVDSIPAIFAVTLDPFIVFTSNIFAILGLRSLYFVLARLMDRFHFFRLSLVVILAYVGFKMILSHHVEIPSWVSLTVIGATLLVGVVASLIRARVVGDTRSEQDETPRASG